MQSDGNRKMILELTDLLDTSRDDSPHLGPTLKGQHFFQHMSSWIRRSHENVQAALLIGSRCMEAVVQKPHNFIFKNFE